MSERIRGSYDDALYKSTYTLLYFTLLTHRVHLLLDGKRIVDFLLAIIELFSLALTAADY